jgi:hypothetical protein
MTARLRYRRSSASVSLRRFVERVAKGRGQCKDFARRWFKNSDGPSFAALFPEGFGQDTFDFKLYLGIEGQDQALPDFGGGFEDVEHLAARVLFDDDPSGAAQKMLLESPFDASFAAFFHFILAEADKTDDRCADQSLGVMALHFGHEFNARQPQILDGLFFFRADFAFQSHEGPLAGEFFQYPGGIQPQTGRQRGCQPWAVLFGTDVLRGNIHRSNLEARGEFTALAVENGAPCRRCPEGFLLLLLGFFTQRLGLIHLQLHEPPHDDEHPQAEQSADGEHSPVHRCRRAVGGGIL